MATSITVLKFAAIAVAALLGLALTLSVVSLAYTRLISPVARHTERIIDASPEQVWEVLADLPSWGQWSPNFVSIAGTLQAGEHLENHVCAGGNELVFRPRVLVAESARELRWKGTLYVPGLADGEHYFELTETPDGRTRFVQGEDFTGALVLYAGSAIDVEDDMRAFNDALAAEVARRHVTVTP
ncbi:SRPBCC domain-containing protein [Bowdeniella nasicola]|uniref:SRPBCC domain-containing protein n=1 Tax=Bowdeniella nasicola TaxID=208480 RepID=UPI0009F88E5D|nr:SRPBCC domain-containing protein [Bowdeniella nasicola]